MQQLIDKPESKAIHLCPCGNPLIKKQGNKSKEAYYICNRCQSISWYEYMSGREGKNEITN